MPVRLTCMHLAAVIGLAAAAAPLFARSGPPPQGPASAASARPVTIDLVALDKDGKPVDTLRAADLAVSIDGVGRTIASVCRVSRGPGAMSDALRRQARADGSLTFAAEPSRNVLVIIDQAGLAQGEERPVTQAAGALLDRVGIADRVAVLRLPFTADQQVALTTERPAARESLALVAGQIPRADVLAAESPVAQTDRSAMADPGRVSDSGRPADAERPRDLSAGTELQVGTAESELATARGTLAGLLGVLKAMRPLPGRKIVAFFSPGLAAPSAVQLGEVAAAAAAARATLYTFGIPVVRDDPRMRVDMSSLQALSKATGGSFTMLGRNPERVIDRVMGEAASAYTVSLQPAAGDDDRRHAVAVATSRKDVMLRAPAWLLPASSLEDVVPSPPPASLDAPPAVGEHAAATSPLASRSVAPSAKDAELELALGRLYDYVEAYERQYSLLVAEEEYRQIASGKTVRLRSDFLLVKPGTAEDWVSFRDVYEVDGVPVRDREDRLRRLFLDPGVEAQAQLRGIKDDSARYNIGPFKRNVNVPMFPLKFLKAENRARFRYKLAGQTGRDGVDTWRLEFSERQRPALISDGASGDVPASGWFLVEQGTGAIVESGMTLEERFYHATITVRYHLDPGLGMWVPARMDEDFRTSRVTSMAGAVSWETALEGAAVYSRFRRFQVRTEEKVTIVK